MVASSPWLDIRHGDRVRDDATGESDSPADAATEPIDGSNSDEMETKNETKTKSWDSVDATQRPGQTDADQPADD